MAGELTTFPRRREDDKGDFGIAEDRELESLLEKPVSPFGECHLPA